MTTQTEPAVLSAGDARLMAMVFRKEPMPPDLEFAQVDADRWVSALRAIATGTTLCKSSAAEAADRARIAELGAEVEKLRGRVGSGGYCAFCEQTVPAVPGFMLAWTMRTHVEQCPKHPLAQARIELGALAQYQTDASRKIASQESELTALRKERGDLRAVFERLANPDLSQISGGPGPLWTAGVAFEAKQVAEIAREALAHTENQEAK